MAADFEKLYASLEEKLDEAVHVLRKTTIGDDGYKQLLTDIVETIGIVKNFNSIGVDSSTQAPSNPNEVKVGDKFKSYGDFDDDVDRLVVFSSDTCSFCKKMSPVYFPVLKEQNVPYELINLSVEEENKFARSLGVTGVPAFLFIKDGIVVHKFVGYDGNISDEDNKNSLIELIKEHF